MRFGHPDIPDRFWDKVLPVPETGCWLWTPPLKDNGYGQFWTREGMVYPHRWIKGEVPQDKWIDHLCRVRSCVNPDHLEVVTPQENTQRGSLSYETRGWRCANGHDVRVAGVRHDINYPGAGQCRQCQRDYSKVVHDLQKRAAAKLGLTKAAFTRQYGYSKAVAQEVLERGDDS